MTHDPEKAMSDGSLYGDCEPFTVMHQTERVLRAQAAEIDALREALLDAAAHLVAAISLLERGGKAAKKAAPSDKMFDQMLNDYRASADRARAALAAAPAPIQPAPLDAQPGGRVMAETFPERIWLLPNAGNDGETLWCDDPAPGVGMDVADAVEYVRADALIEAERRGAERMRERAAYEVAELFEHTAEENFWVGGAKQARRIAAAIRALPLTEEN